MLYLNKINNVGDYDGLLLALKVHGLISAWSKTRLSSPVDDRPSFD